MEEFQSKNVRVVAMMTAPRYEAVYARNQIEKSLKAIGIPMMVSGGVYYGQCMQMMLSKVLEEEVDYALTVDFDSMFTAKHVQRLLSIIAAHDQIDALAAAQPKRGCGDILASSAGGREVEWKGFPLKVDSAHFGLTVIDLNKLREVPKPWFLAVPNEVGDWEGGKIDDDVYFWRQWQEAGHSVYIDPGCRLGHLEELVTVFDDQMQLVHQYPKDWMDSCDSTVD